MASVHIFAYDWIPGPDDIASGGGLRGLQLVEALREAGEDVTFSVPSNCRHLQRLGRGHPSLRDVHIHNADNQLDILRETRPQVIIWTPFGRDVPPHGPPGTIHVYDMIGLPHVEAAFGVKSQIRRNRDRLLRLSKGIDLFLTGSEEQNGYLLSMLTSDGTEVVPAIVPYALPASLSPTGARKSSRLRRLHVTGMIYPWSTSIPPLRDAAEWVSRRAGVTLSIIAGTDPGGATDRAVLRALDTISGYPNVLMHGEQTFAKAMNDYGPGSVALDVYDTNTERRLAVPIRTVNALTHGVPVVTTINSTFTRQIEAAGAGLVVEDDSPGALERMLDRLEAMSVPEMERISRAARAFAIGRFDPASISGSLDRAVRMSLRRKAEEDASWRSPAPPATPLGHVLVLTSAGSKSDRSAGTDTIRRDARMRSDFGLFGLE